MPSLSTRVLSLGRNVGESHRDRVVEVNALAVVHDQQCVMIATLANGDANLTCVQIVRVLHNLEEPLKRLVPLTNVCKESKSSPLLNCVESATCESQQ